MTLETRDALVTIILASMNLQIHTQFKMFEISQWLGSGNSSENNEG
jgi:hypothetical protein